MSLGPDLKTMTDLYAINDELSRSGLKLTHWATALVCWSLALVAICVTELKTHMSLVSIALLLVIWSALLIQTLRWLAYNRCANKRFDIVNGGPARSSLR